MAQEEVWQVVLTKPAEKVYDRVDEDMQQRLDRCFEELEENPLYGTSIRPLTGQLRGLYRYRVGDWRVIYRIFREGKIVEVIAILPRGDAYQERRLNPIRLAGKKGISPRSLRDIERLVFEHQGILKEKYYEFRNR